MNELARRIAVTIGLLLAVRLGSYIPLPGIDPAVWASVYGQNEGGALGAANATSGGAIARLSIFALGLVPYLSAALLIQVASVVSFKPVQVPDEVTVATALPPAGSKLLGLSDNPMP